MGTSQALDAAEDMYLLELQEVHIVTRNLLGAFGPIVARAVKAAAMRSAEDRQLRLRWRLKAQEEKIRGEKAQAQAEGEGTEGEKEGDEEEEEEESLPLPLSRTERCAQLRLREAAVLCLCKFMCISSKFCSGGEGDPHLRLLFTQVRLHDTLTFPFYHRLLACVSSP